MTAAATTPLPRPTPRATRRRLATVAAEIGVAVGICLLGFYVAAGWFREQEAALAVRVLRLLGFADMSAVLPGSILIYRGPDDVLQGVVTTSCSSLLTVVGLTALTAVVLRGRRWHAVGGLLVALVAVVAANCGRLVLSALAGYEWGGPAMTLFHDWVGTVWALVSTLAGFLLMVCLTLPAAERAEQDVAGRHTARRPDSWARPGLGYRVQEVEQRAVERRRHRFSPTAFWYRRVLPRRVAARLAAQREAGRIDYRIGHQTPAERVATVQRLTGEGLGVHTASLLAVATYDTDLDVLDALADAVAARQWEPVVSHRVTALRLWARGWLLARRQFAAGNSSTTLIATARPGPARPGGPPRHRAAHPAQLRPPPASGTPMTLAPARPPSPLPLLPPAPLPPVPSAADLARHRPAVLVTGAGGPAGVAVVRRLLATGHRVVAADADPRAAGGALADVAVVLPRADHPGYVDALVAAAAEHGVDAVVPTVAEELTTLRSVAFWLTSAGIATWLPEVAAVELCCDKARFARRMVEAEVAHPGTAADVDGLDDVVGPWVVKPRAGRGSRGVQLLESRAAVVAALRADPQLVAQTRLAGREFTADALVARDGELLTVVPRWRDATKAGISVQGTTFDSEDVTALVAATLAAVGLTGPANVQGFVADDGTATVVEVNPRFSGGLPLTLAAGADVVSAYLTGIRSPGTRLAPMQFTPGVAMSRYFAETYTGPDGHPVPDPCDVTRARA